MRLQQTLIAVFLSLLLASLACQSISVSQMTATPEPTIPPTPLSTSTSASPAASLLELGEAIDPAELGFTFRPVQGFDLQPGENQVTLSSTTMGVIISLGSGPAEGKTLEEALEVFLDAAGRNVQNLEAEDSFELFVAGEPALAVDVRGDIGDLGLTGRQVVASIDEDRLFFAFAMAFDGPDGARWLTPGEPVFNLVLDTVSFQTAR